MEHTEPNANKKGLRKLFEQKLSNKHFRRIAVVLLTFIAVGLYLLVLKGPSATPFPPGVASELTYPVYFAEGAPSGYNYKPASRKIEADILFYTMSNGKKNIYITEQAKPPNEINLKSLPKHSPLPVPIGNAVIGTSLGNPSVVIITPTTMIQITSSKGVSTADVVSIAQKMTQLQI